MAAKRQWKDLSPRARVAVIVGGAVQVALIALAHADLTRRTDAQVRGPKRMWRLITLINFVGPITYFAVGRETGAQR
jgi:hypothetical protein